jgi:GT2 family glycosyltransferase
MIGEKILTIITLNWNGWKDTIECLSSILNSFYKNYNIICIDNSSSDNSVNKIKEWLKNPNRHPIETKFSEYVLPLKKNPIPYIELEFKNGQLENFSPDKKTKIILIKSDRNLGFATANNLGIKIAINIFRSKYIFLLNNDTVIASDALQNLVNILEENKNIGVAQAAIYNYSDKNRLIHAGGYVLFWGQYKYYKSISEHELKKIKFASGCAICMRSEVLSKYGYLSEKFFFGEEDFEFSLRMNHHRIGMVCVSDCKVYHKISVSSKKMIKNFQRSVVLYSLNRMVNMKDYYPVLIWYIWRIPALIYFTVLLIFHYKVPIIKSLKSICIVWYFSSRIKDMKKKNFDLIFEKFE